MVLNKSDVDHTLALISSSKTPFTYTLHTVSYPLPLVNRYLASCSFLLCPKPKLLPLVTSTFLCSRHFNLSHSINHTFACTLQCLLPNHLSCLFNFSPNSRTPSIRPSIYFTSASPLLSSPNHISKTLFLSLRTLHTFYTSFPSNNKLNSNISLLTSAPILDIHFSLPDTHFFWEVLAFSSFIKASLFLPSTHLDNFNKATAYTSQKCYPSAGSKSCCVVDSRLSRWLIY